MIACDPALSGWSLFGVLGLIIISIVLLLGWASEVSNPNRKKDCE